MKNLQNALIDQVSNNSTLRPNKVDNEITAIHQTDRNNMVRDLAKVVYKTLAEHLDHELIQVVELKNAVGIVCDNEKIGYIPLILTLSSPKDLQETDLVADSEEYLLSLETKAQAKADKEKAKADKVAKQQAERQAKAQAKADKE